MSLMLSNKYFKMTTQPAQCLSEDVEVECSASRVNILEHHLSITGEHYHKGVLDYKAVYDWLITLVYNNDNTEPCILFDGKKLQ